MKFEEIILHLRERGFATRSIWGNQSYIFYDLSNSLKISVKFFVGKKESIECYLYNLTLEDINASDWETTDLYYKNYIDMYLPFAK